MAPYITVKLKGRSGSRSASRGVCPTARQYFQSRAASLNPDSFFTKKRGLGGPSQVAAAAKDRDREQHEVAVAQLPSVERQGMWARTREIERGPDLGAGVVLEARPELDQVRRELEHALRGRELLVRVGAVANPQPRLLARRRPGDLADWSTVDGGPLRVLHDLRPLRGSGRIAHLQARIHSHLHGRAVTTRTARGSVESLVAP